VIDSRFANRATPVASTAAQLAVGLTGDGDGAAEPTPGGFIGSVSATNRGAAVNGWTVRLTCPDAGQRIIQGWGASQPSPAATR
jgi:hypothetical protein